MSLLLLLALGLTHPRAVFAAPGCAGGGNAREDLQWDIPMLAPERSQALRRIDDITHAGAAKLREGQHLEAVQLFTIATHRGSDSGTSMFNLGVALSELGSRITPRSALVALCEARAALRLAATVGFSPLDPVVQVGDDMPLRDAVSHAQAHLDSKLERVEGVLTERGEQAFRCADLPPPPHSAYLHVLLPN